MSSVESLSFWLVFLGAQLAMVAGNEVYGARFKPVAGGYVFQIRSPWLFGPQRRYLVNETQKAEIIARLRSSGRRAMKSLLIYCLIAVLSIFGAAIAATMLHPHSGSAVGALFITAIIPALMFLVVSIVHETRRLYSFLGALPRTSERISLHERRELYVAAVSFRLLLLQFLLFGLLTLFAVSSAAERLNDRWNFDLYFNLVFAITFAFTTAWFAYLLFLKWRRPRGDLRN